MPTWLEGERRTSHPSDDDLRAQPARHSGQVTHRPERILAMLRGVPLSRARGLCPVAHDWRLLVTSNCAGPRTCETRLLPQKCPSAANDAIPVSLGQTIDSRA